MDELFQRMQARAYANAFAVYNHLELEEAEDDRALLRLTAVANSCNPYGIIHGGALYTLADSACGTAIHSDGRAYVTQRGELSYLSNRRMGDTVWGEARVIHRGRSTSLIHVDIRDAEGVVLATGDFSYFCVDQNVGENPDIKEWKK